jgi:hypothetical protein
LMKIRRSRYHKEVSIDESKEMEDSCVPLEIEDWRPNPEQRYSQRELQRILATTINELEPGIPERLSTSRRRGVHHGRNGKGTCSFLVSSEDAFTTCADDVAKLFEQVFPVK